MTSEVQRRGDLEWVSVPRLVESSAARFSTVEALVDGELRLSYPELAAMMRRVARAAAATGLEPGDRAAIWAPNVGEWILAALGVLAAGGIVVPVNTRFKGAEAAHVLRTSGARMLFTVEGFLGTSYVTLLRDVLSDLAELQQVVILRGDAPPGTTAWAEFLDGAERVDDAEITRRIVAVSGEDLSDVIFTSGTTGRPKGVMTTHAQTLRVFDVYSDAVGLRAGDRYLVVNPFFHTFGYKAGAISAIMRGATIIPHAVFEVVPVMRKIEQERVTVLPGPPTVLQSILDAPERASYDLSSLRLTMTGATVVPVELVKRLQSEMTFETVLTGYGLTETSAVVSVCHQGEDPETVAHWSGRVIPDVEVRVVDDEGNDVALGEPGEVLVRGYVVMRGYWNDPEQTAATIDPDGWLHTGDLGVLDDRGYVKITGRKKDMFIVGGFNAYPAEIEDLLLAQGDVAQVAVVGVPDARLGEVGAAFVVAKHGAAIEPASLIAWARETMANYKVPRYAELVESLPVNAGGKVDKEELRARGRELVARQKS
jgi:acyl-CoA synthetase (AMP-forming)/AMP-acid ligase II